jgi:hypothetical protein
VKPCASAQRTYIRASIGAPRARVDFQEGVVAVGFPVKKRLQLLRLGDLHQIGQGLFGLGHDFGVALGLAEFDQFDIVLQPARDQLVAGHRVQQRLTVTHQLLRLGRVVPEIGRLDHGVEFFQPVRGRLPVHPLGQKLQRLFDRLDVGLRFGAHVTGPVLLSRGRS